MKRRRDRLTDLLAHSDFAGNKTELGRALGYKDGAFVGQMLRGERPVSEKTIEQIETFRGSKYAGWFVGDSENAATAHWPFTPELREAIDKMAAKDDGADRLRRAENVLRGFLDMEGIPKPDGPTSGGEVVQMPPPYLDRRGGDDRRARSRKTKAEGSGS